MKTLLVLLACTTAAYADSSDPRNELELGSWQRALRTPSANAVTGDDIGGGTFSYARQLPLDVVPDLGVWAVASYAGGSTSGTMFTMATDIAYLHLMGGLRARYRVWDALRVGGRATLGSARTSLVLDDGMRTYSDRKWGSVAEAAAEVELLAVSRRSFAFGLRAEYGYTQVHGVPLAPRADEVDGDTIALPVTQASLGKLDLGGPFFAITVIGQF